MIKQSALSLQYVQAQVSATAAGSPINPTGDVVQFAFPLDGAQPSTWYTGSWDGTSPRSNGMYVAHCLVGPGGTVTLTAGSYNVWVKVTDSPEVPVIDVGLLQIT